MNQQEAIKAIKNRGVYRHAKGSLFTVAGFGQHMANKVLIDGTEEKEEDVILTTINKDGTTGVVIMPVLKFHEPFGDDKQVRFTEII